MVYTDENGKNKVLSLKSNVLIDGQQQLYLGIRDQTDYTQTRYLKLTKDGCKDLDPYAVHETSIIDFQIGVSFQTENNDNVVNNNKLFIHLIMISPQMDEYQPEGQYLIFSNSKFINRTINQINSAEWNEMISLKNQWIINNRRHGKQFYLKVIKTHEEINPEITIDNLIKLQQTSILVYDIPFIVDQHCRIFTAESLRHHFDQKTDVFVIHHPQIALDVKNAVSPTLESLGLKNPCLINVPDKYKEVSKDTKYNQVLKSFKTFYSICISSEVPQLLKQHRHLSKTKQQSPRWLTTVPIPFQKWNKNQAYDWFISLHPLFESKFGYKLKIEDTFPVFNVSKPFFDQIFDDLRNINNSKLVLPELDKVMNWNKSDLCSEWLEKTTFFINEKQVGLKLLQQINKSSLNGFKLLTMNFSDIEMIDNSQAFLAQYFQLKSLFFNRWSTQETRDWIKWIISISGVSNVSSVSDFSESMTIEQLNKVVDENEWNVNNMNILMEMTEYDIKIMLPGNHLFHNTLMQYLNFNKSIIYNWSWEKFLYRLKKILNINQLNKNDIVDFLCSYPGNEKYRSLLKESNISSDFTTGRKTWSIDKTLSTVSNFSLMIDSLNCITFVDDYSTTIELISELGSYERIHFQTICKHIHENNINGMNGIKVIRDTILSHLKHQSSTNISTTFEIFEIFEITNEFLNNRNVLNIVESVEQLEQFHSCNNISVETLLSSVDRMISFSTLNTTVLNCVKYMIEKYLTFPSHSLPVHQLFDIVSSTFYNFDLNCRKLWTCMGINGYHLKLLVKELHNYLDLSELFNKNARIGGKQTTQLYVKDKNLFEFINSSFKNSTSEWYQDYINVIQEYYEKTFLNNLFGYFNEFDGRTLQLVSNIDSEQFFKNIVAHSFSQYCSIRLGHLNNNSQMSN